MNGAMRTWGFSFLSLVIQRKAKTVGTLEKETEGGVESKRNRGRESD